MADFSAPSFSLGLDFDLDSDPPTDGEEAAEAEEPSLPKPTEHEFPIEDDEDEFGPRALESDLREEDPPRVLKRLRRGPPPPAARHVRKQDSIGAVHIDDEIEEFSSQEDRYRDEWSSLRSGAACSNSKFSLHCHGILASQSASKLKVPKSSPVSNISDPKNFEASSSKKLFPRLTISPLRKIQLLDSDSDDPSSSKDKPKDTKWVYESKKERQFAATPFMTMSEQKKTKFPSNTFQTESPSESQKERQFAATPFMTRSEQKKTKLPCNTFQTESPWKDFTPKINKNLPTPVLDEFCVDYFRSMKDSNVGQCKEGDMIYSNSTVLDPDDFVNDFGGYHQKNSIAKNAEHNWNMENPHPPAYLYFYHDDARIQKLVRERLPYFVPLGAVDPRENQQFGTENVDYMGQFGPRDVPSRAPGTSEKGFEGSSKTPRKKPSRSNAKKASQACGSWVNPRSSATIPKDAGQRRVRADGQQAGRWLTGQDGRKVYVTKNGQELTGQTAYRHYRKDNGAGFRKSRKKAVVKKKRKR